MNKTQRDYTISRIQSAARGKEFKCECETPSLAKHIRRAIANGSAKVKPAKTIFAFFDKKIIEDNDRWDDPKAGLTELFEEPDSYKAAMADLHAEQKQHADANDAVKRFSQGIIDRVELGEFEDGKEAIRLMEAYAPESIKSRKK